MPPPPALKDLTHDLRDLAHLATDDESVDVLLQRGLEWLGRLASFDLATVFELKGDTLVVRAAFGPLASDRLREHKLSLARFPSIREAINLRRARAYTETDHAHGDGDPFDGVLDFPPGHSCMVVPLCSPGNALGVLTLDRARCETYASSVVDVVEVYAQMLALALVNAEQRVALRRLREQEMETGRLLTYEVFGDSGSILETSRAPALMELARRVRQAAPTDTPILVRGETGTGKERLARAIHGWSRRADRPFVKLNCAAVPAGLLESELFGHLRGAFTGATKDRAGRFQTANGGTLLLDEIGELPLDLQAKLLRVLQEGTFEAVGSDRTVKVDVRLIAATHVDLEDALARHTFREDLYYRLNVFPVTAPPLRERLVDLPLLCSALLDEQVARTGRRGYRVTEGGLEHLRAYAWPGNIRELANLLERATILATSRELGPDDLVLPSTTAATPMAPTNGKPRAYGTLDEAQRIHIAQVLSATEGRIYGPGGAAEILGMKPSTLQSRMKRLGVGG